MRFFRLLALSTIVLAAGVSVAAQAPEGQAGDARRAAAASGPVFTMTMGFPDGTELPRTNSALGAMISPEVNWANPPAGTMSFATSTLLFQFESMAS